jgi:hypothetical protein
MLKENRNLRSLLIRWNNIQNKGGRMIGNALCQNYFLKILDVSFNAFGTDDVMYNSVLEKVRMVDKE